MKAIQYSKYGAFETMKLIEKPIPEPKRKQILIHVKNSSTNAMEWHIFRGLWMVRLKCGLFKPSKRFNVQGADISGEVFAVGSEVKNFKKGDQVFGDIFSGGYAEYAIAEEHQLAIKPNNVSHEQAATIPVAGMTALKALCDVAKVNKGDHILINGASGGVGTFAVQMAKHYGVKVTAVCSEKNAAAIRSLGADELIDYNVTDFCAEGKKYDHVIDIVGNRTPKEMKGILKPGGICAVVGMTTLSRMFRFMLHPSKKIKMVSVAPNTEVLNTLGEMLSKGHVKSYVTAVLPLAEVPAAIKLLSTRRVCGKQGILIQ
ncbi:MAG: NADPH:quinone reductase-like Zn-dependent oxidoreductase [Crocinitomix sp.]|jgi:NADPH:quinone reductase-like Zn-dependent oxidoreductase